VDATKLQKLVKDQGFFIDGGYGKIKGTTFSARWTGFITANYSENYTFQTLSDDGVRLWINGRLIIDDWTDHPPRIDTGTIDLVADSPTSIHLEFYDAGGGAQITLSWKSQSQSLQVVPTTALSSTGRLLPDFFPPYWYNLASKPSEFRLNAETLAKYQIERSNNLTDWEPVIELPQFRGATNLDQLQMNSPADFFRVKGER